MYEFLVYMYDMTFHLCVRMFILFPVIDCMEMCVCVHMDMGDSA